MCYPGINVATWRSLPWWRSSAVRRWSRSQQAPDTAQLSPRGGSSTPGARGAMVDLDMVGSVRCEVC